MNGSFQRSRHQVRAAVVVKIAIMIPVIGGFAAAGIDLTYLHSMQNDLQRAADAAALSGALLLGSSGMEATNPAIVAAAQEVVDRNPVGNQSVILESSDVILGRATYDAETGRYSWVGPATEGTNAVQVTLRRTEGSPSGPVPLFFLRLLGRSWGNVSALARAAVLPRDIALVIDLSGSMNDDSELRNYQRVPTLNLPAIWNALGSPTYGRMTTWGTNPITPAYVPGTSSVNTDPGLILMTHNTTFSAAVDPHLTAQGYTTAERNALKKLLMSTDVPLPGGPTYSSPNWINRTAAVLGLARWHSGKSGGAFPGSGQGPGSPDGDNFVEDHEMEWVVPYPFSVGSWRDWIGEYMSRPPAPLQSFTYMTTANTNFRYRFGLKTFVNYLLEYRPSFAETNVLWQTPEQPLRAVKDAVGEIVSLLTEFNIGDQLSLEVFATTARHEQSLTLNYDTVLQTLLQRQSNHYDNQTCIGCGIDQGRLELTTSGNARSGVQRMLVLLTDGIANVDSAGTIWPDNSPGDAAAYAESAAQQAANAQITLHTIVVGAEASNPIVENLLRNIAAVGHGEFFAAGGTVADYSERLREVFRRIAGSYRAVLIP